MKTGNHWDIFCRVIDNFGDIGVCWRLATDLVGRGERVRLWVDDAGALAWMAPEGTPPGIEVRPWTQPLELDGVLPGDILVEAFGCEVPPEFIAVYRHRIGSTGQTPTWINLEYLSAEAFSERCHGLPSPVMTGPGSGLIKRFFYPGFSAATGGLLRESDLIARQARFDRSAWLRGLNISFQGQRLVSLFCYEPGALGDLLDQLASDRQPTLLLVTPGRAAAAVRACLESNNRRAPAWNGCGTLSFLFLPALSQRDFDHLLWACDLNFVRGEDSLVRALWAAKPFVWQIYPQHDNAHHIKLEALLNQFDAPTSWRVFHQIWNGLPGASCSRLPRLELAPWGKTAARARARQLQQDDLVTRILSFVSKNR